MTLFKGVIERITTSGGATDVTAAAVLTDNAIVQGAGGARGVDSNATGNRVTKGWFTDIETTNAPSVNGVAASGTGAIALVNGPTFVAPVLGTPASGVATNLTGTAAGLTAGNVTTNANLTGAVTSVGNAASLGSFTSAQLATALTDETGSGANVFANTPTLVTPVLGAATATSINFGGTSLANYVEGTWTPTDNSGAALSLTVTSATYTRIGRVIYVQANITYPTTVSGASASLAGLPTGLTVAANSGATAVVGTGASIAARVYFTPGSLTMTLLQVVGSAPVTNTQLSAATVQFMGAYFV